MLFYFFAKFTIIIMKEKTLFLKEVSYDKDYVCSYDSNC